MVYRGFFALLLQIYFCENALAQDCGFAQCQESTQQLVNLAHNVNQVLLFQELEKNYYHLSEQKFRRLETLHSIEENIKIISCKDKKFPGIKIYILPKKKREKSYSYPGIPVGENIVDPVRIVREAIYRKYFSLSLNECNGQGNPCTMQKIKELFKNKSHEEITGILKLLVSQDLRVHYPEEAFEASAFQSAIEDSAILLEYLQDADRKNQVQHLEKNTKNLSEESKVRIALEMNSILAMADYQNALENDAMPTLQASALNTLFFPIVAIDAKNDLGFNKFQKQFQSDLQISSSAASGIYKGRYIDKVEINNGLGKKIFLSSYEESDSQQAVVSQKEDSNDDTKKFPIQFWDWELSHLPLIETDVLNKNTTFHLDTSLKSTAGIKSNLQQIIADYDLTESLTRHKLYGKSELNLRAKMPKVDDIAKLDPKEYADGEIKNTLRYVDKEFGGYIEGTYAIDQSSWAANIAGALDFGPAQVTTNYLFHSNDPNQNSGPYISGTYSGSDPDRNIDYSFIAVYNLLKAELTISGDFKLP